MTAPTVESQPDVSTTQIITPSQAQKLLHDVSIIRGWATAIGVLMVLGVIGGIIGVAMMLVSLSHETTAINGGPTPSSTCSSQGGWDISC